MKECSVNLFCCWSGQRVVNAPTSTDISTLRISISFEIKPQLAHMDDSVEHSVEAAFLDKHYICKP